MRDQIRDGLTWRSENSNGRGIIENGHSYFQIMVNRAGLEPATRC
jgi:hypothetical protein